MNPFREESASIDGGEVAMRRREGASDAGTLVFVHANGLNKGAYVPMLDALSVPETVLALDLRGHGGTTLPADPARLTRWDTYGADLSAILDAVGARPPVTLAGHSMGAVSLLLAASKGADAARLIMIEPVVLPGAARLIARTPLRGPLIRKKGIAAQAARRRSEWPDAASARAQYAETPFFSGWDEEALDGYLADGLERQDGRAALRCDPAWEAASFAAQAHRFWKPLGEVAKRMPVHLLKARGRSTVPPSSLLRLARSGARLTEMDGSHMLPTERPRQTAAYLGLTMRGGGV